VHWDVFKCKKICVFILEALTALYTNCMDSCVMTTSSVTYMYSLGAGAGAGGGEVQLSPHLG